MNDSRKATKVYTPGAILGSGLKAQSNNRDTVVRNRQELSRPQPARAGCSQGAGVQRL